MSYNFWFQIIFRIKLSFRTVVVAQVTVFQNHGRHISLYPTRLTLRISVPMVVDGSLIGLFNIYVVIDSAVLDYSSTAASKSAIISIIVSHKANINQVSQLLWVHLHSKYHWAWYTCSYCRLYWRLSGGIIFIIAQGIAKSENFSPENNWFNLLSMAIEPIDNRRFTTATICSSGRTPGRSAS